MAISKYPDVELPDGAIGLIFEGTSNQGGYVYNSSPVGAGNYLVQIKGSAKNATYLLGADRPFGETAPSGSDPTLTVGQNEFLTLSTASNNIYLNNISNFTTSLNMSTTSFWGPGTTYGGVTYFAARQGGSDPSAIIATTDGVNFTTSLAFASSVRMMGLINNDDGVYMAGVGGPTNGSRVTTDFVNWSTVTGGNTTMLRGGQGKFFGLNNNSATQILVSTDSLNFNTVSVSTNFIPNLNLVYSTRAGVFIGNGSGLPVGSRNTFNISTDGFNWARQTVPGGSASSGSIGGVGYGNGVFVGQTKVPLSTTYSISMSTNGTTWTILTTETNSSTDITTFGFINGNWYGYILAEDNARLYWDNFKQYISLATVMSNDDTAVAHPNKLSLTPISGKFVYGQWGGIYGNTMVSEDTSYLAMYSYGKNVLN